MSLLSITFHCEFDALNDWEQYKNQSLKKVASKIPQVKHYILSDVETAMLQEGKNTNLLLIFSDDHQRQLFLENELAYIQQDIESEFQTKVLVFVTLLNPFETTL